MSDEKRTEELPKVRVSPELRDALIRLSVADDRSLSDYVRFVLATHVFGHAHKLGPEPEER